ncbi:MAG: hypothetical protein COA47_02270 [Robiginitomaculum sp.]|nr:MAG: hypothetical protein COA47_02270 [Robiginitomaculum sp.]
MTLNRRNLLTIMAALPFAAGARAQQLPPAMLELMNHPAAGFFEAPPPGSGIPLNLPIRTHRGTGNWMQLFGGRAVLLDLWASWCGPCLVETPGLNALAANHNSEVFSVVALQTADPKTSFRELIKLFADNQLDNLVPMADASPDNWGYFRALKVNHRNSGQSAGLPMAALIGPDGREIARTYGTIEGGKWTHPLMMDFISRFAKAWH